MLSGLCVLLPCRGGQWVLSKEDPTETFFKRLPKDTTRVEVLYPVSSCTG